MGMIERSFKNAVLVSVIGQIPPFTAVPEELLSVPLAIGLGIAGVDIIKTLGVKI